jgi:hypothetical protein
MSRIKVAELRPVGFELFQDSETFLDELCDDWELDSARNTPTTLAISHAIGLNSFPTDISTKPDLILNSSSCNEKNS